MILPIYKSNPITGESEYIGIDSELKKLVRTAEWQILAFDKAGLTRKQADKRYKDRQLYKKYVSKLSAEDLEALAALKCLKARKSFAVANKA